MARSRNPTSKARPAALLVAALTAICLAAGDEQEGIVFHDSLATAQRIARAEKRVTVVYFTAPWCAWCQKMSVSTLADRRVLALRDRFVWAKVDVSTHPEFAAQSGVLGVPFLILLNVEGEVIASRGGYVTAEEMVTLLRASADKAETPGKAGTAEQAIEKMNSSLAAATRPADRSAAVAEAVALLARPQRAGRREVLEAIWKLGASAWGGLLACMRDEALGVRAAGGEALAYVTGANLPFDPFAEPQVRAAQIAAWEKWIKENADCPTTRPSPATRPATRPSE